MNLIQVTMSNFKGLENWAQHGHLKESHSYTAPNRLS